MVAGSGSLGRLSAQRERVQTRSDVPVLLFGSMTFEGFVAGVFDVPNPHVWAVLQCLGMERFRVSNRLLFEVVL